MNMYLVHFMAFAWKVWHACNCWFTLSAWFKLTHRCNIILLKSWWGVIEILHNTINAQFLQSILDRGDNSWQLWIIYCKQLREPHKIEVHQHNTDICLIVLKVLADLRLKRSAGSLIGPAESESDAVFFSWAHSFTVILALSNKILNTISKHEVKLSAKS